MHHFILRRLVQLGIVDHPGLYYSLEEGYRQYAFGAKAGPSCSVENLFHELGHAAEFGPDLFRSRCRVGSFHFKVPYVYVLGKRCAEPTTSQMTQREIRVVAHQFHLMQLAGMTRTVRAYARDQSNTLDFVPDYCHLGEKEERHAVRMQMIMERIDAYRASDCLDRLVGWLDATVERMKRGPRSKYPTLWPITTYTGRGVRAAVGSPRPIVWV
jgi:hypothetical protein